MSGRPLPAGVGLGWRPAFAGVPDAFPGLAFAEVMAEPRYGEARLPASLAAWRARGLPVVPHGVGLSLGSADPPDRGRLRRLARLATALGAPLVSEHVAFVRAGGLEAGHLLPVPRTRAALAVLVENVKRAQDALPVPLALENGAPLCDWPDAELDEAAFLGELAARTGCWLLLDLANMHANAVNFGRDPLAMLDALPLDRVAYVHLAGGAMRDGRYEDTHVHPLAPGPLDLLAALVARVGPVPALLERDDAFPPLAETVGELAAIAGKLLSPALRAPPPLTGEGEDFRPDRAPITHRPSPTTATSADRRALAAAQAAWLRALSAGGPVPPGADPAAMAAASAQLLRKRRRAVARAFPRLHAWLGDAFEPAFAAHAARRPPRGEGAFRDGLAFARGLPDRGWPEEVARELARARWRHSPVFTLGSKAAGIFGAKYRNVFST